MNQVVGLKFHRASKGESPLVAYLPTQSGGHVVFPAARSAAEMTRPGWHLVKLTFAGEIAIADPIITWETIRASSDVLNAFLDMSEDQLRTDGDNGDAVILFFEENGAGPLHAALPSENGDIDIFPASDMEQYMQEPGWYLIQVELVNSTTGFATPITSKENLTAAQNLLDEHFELAHLRRAQSERRSRHPNESLFAAS